MATEVPLPAALENRCVNCHQTDPQNRARVARRQIEDVARLRSTLRRATFEINTIKDTDRKTALTKQWTDADLSLRNAAAGMHAFNQERVDDRLSDARTQVERLAAALARR